MRETFSKLHLQAPALLGINRLIMQHILSLMPEADVVDMPQDPEDPDSNKHFITVTLPNGTQRAWGLRCGTEDARRRHEEEVAEELGVGEPGSSAGFSVDKIQANYDLLTQSQEPSGSLRWSVLRVYKQKLTQEKRIAALRVWDEDLNNGMMAKRRRVVETQNEKQDKQITITTKSIKTNNKTKQTNKQTNKQVKLQDVQQDPPPSSTSPLAPSSTLQLQSLLIHDHDDDWMSERDDEEDVVMGLAKPPLDPLPPAPDTTFDYAAFQDMLVEGEDDEQLGPPENTQEHQASQQELPVNEGAVQEHTEEPEEESHITWDREESEESEESPEPPETIAYDVDSACEELHSAEDFGLDHSSKSHQWLTPQQLEEVVPLLRMRAEGDPDEKMARAIIRLAQSWIDNMHDFTSAKVLADRLAEYVKALRQQHQALLTQRSQAWMWTHWQHEQDRVEECIRKAQTLAQGVPGSSAGTPMDTKIKPCPPLAEAPCPLMTNTEYLAYEKNMRKQFAAAPRQKEIYQHQIQNLRMSNNLALQKQGSRFAAMTNEVYGSLQCLKQFILTGKLAGRKLPPPVRDPRSLVADTRRFRPRHVGKPEVKARRRQVYYAHLVADLRSGKTRGSQIYRRIHQLMEKGYAAGKGKGCTKGTSGSSADGPATTVSATPKPAATTVSATPKPAATTASATPKPATTTASATPKPVPTGIEWAQLHTRQAGLTAVPHPDWEIRSWRGGQYWYQKSTGWWQRFQQ